MSLTTILKAAKELISPSPYPPALVAEPHHTLPHPDYDAAVSLLVAAEFSGKKKEFLAEARKSTAASDQVLTSGQTPKTIWQQRLAGIAGLLESSGECLFHGNMRKMPVLWMFPPRTLTNLYKLPSDVPAHGLETGYSAMEAGVIGLPSSCCDALNTLALAHELAHTRHEICKLMPHSGYNCATYLEMSLAVEFEAEARALRTLWTLPNKEFHEAIWTVLRNNPQDAPLAAVFEKEVKNSRHGSDALDVATQLTFCEPYENAPEMMLTAMNLAYQDYASLTTRPAKIKTKVPNYFYTTLFGTPDGHVYVNSVKNVELIAHYRTKEVLGVFASDKPALQEQLKL